MSKSAVRVAREALAAGWAGLPEYGSRFSRRDYTQAQLFALHVLRQFLRADHRDVVALVAEWAEWRRALGLLKVPHYSTLAHASRRILADAEAGGLFRQAQAVVVRRALGRGLIDAAPVAAVDATGLETRYVSAYFGQRRGSGEHCQRAGPKLTSVVHAHFPLILGTMPGVGPSQDSPDFTAAIRQAAALIQLDRRLSPDGRGYGSRHHGRRRSIPTVRGHSLRRATASAPLYCGRRWSGSPRRASLRRMA
jgi:hypothetical protein